MACPMICATVMIAVPIPLMMPEIYGAAAEMVCRMTGTTVWVMNVKILSMMGFTVVLAKFTS